MSSPLAGAWEIESDTHQGVAVYTDTHFSIVVAPKNRQRSQSSVPTAEEVMDVYNTVAALSGTYTTSGSRATLKRLANTRLDVVGEDMVFDFNIDGDKLTTRTVSGSSRGGGENIWRKVI